MIKGIIKLIDVFFNSNQKVCSRIDIAIFLFFVFLFLCSFIIYLHRIPPMFRSGIMNKLEDMQSKNNRNYLSVKNDIANIRNEYIEHLLQTIDDINLLYKILQRMEENNLIPENTNMWEIIERKTIFKSDPYEE